MTKREAAIRILKCLQFAGYEAYFVGGCVRDEMRGVTPQDYDLATSAHPEDVESLFPKTIEVGKRFGVVLVLWEGWQFEVATFRYEEGYYDGRRPSKVQYADVKTDASRRDFTVNGLFFDPLTDTVYDWVNGQSDLKSSTLRTIGDPVERFGEDNLRLLRAVRFAAQLNYEIESDTFSALQAQSSLIKNVSAERVRNELCSLFRFPHAARGLDLLLQSQLLGHLLPELVPTIDCDQSPDFHPEGSVYNHIRMMFSIMPKDHHHLLPWTILLHDIAKPQTRSIDGDGRIHFYGHEKTGAKMSENVLKRLRFSKADIESVVQTVYYHMQFKDSKKMRKATLRKMLLRPNFDLELQQHRLDCLGSHGKLDIYEFLSEQRSLLKAKPVLFTPLVNGKDLIQLGLKPSPLMGKLLGEIRDKQLSEEITTREDALAWVKEKAAL